MEQQCLISIIVPVFNVEKYLKKCIDSLLHQRNIDFLYEIILVDDGSTDNSGSICDSYSKNNKRVFTYHKINGGLSDARNYGLKYAKGEYIAYVDSDDYVDSDFLDILSRPIKSNKVDLVIAKHDDEYEINPKKFERHCADYQKLNSEQALEKMCYEIEFGTTACAKLIKKEITTKNVFPMGKLYEDLATIYKIIDDSNEIFFIPISVYHYVQRDRSITKSKWNNRVLDVMEATDSMISFIKHKYSKLDKACAQRYFFSANEVFVRASNEENFKEIIEPIKKQLLFYWNIAKTDKKINWKQKIRYFMMTYCPVLYVVLRNKIVILVKK